MNIELIRKVLATLLFIVSVVFMYFIFKQLDVESIKMSKNFLFAGLSFSLLFLFGLVFTKTTTTKIIYKENKEEINEDIKKESIEHIKKSATILSEKHISSILSNIEKHSYINKFAESLLIKFAQEFRVVQGITYVKNVKTNKFEVVATYALYGKKENNIFETGIGINGQVVLNKKMKIIKDIPEGYINVVSGLGSSSLGNMLIMPFVYNGETVALTEIASFEPFPDYINEIYNKINNKIAEKFNKLNS